MYWPINRMVMACDGEMMVKCFLFVWLANAKNYVISAINDKQSQIHIDISKSLQNHKLHCCFFFDDWPITFLRRPHTLNVTTKKKKAAKQQTERIVCLFFFVYETHKMRKKKEWKAERNGGKEKKYVDETTKSKNKAIIKQRESHGQNHFSLSPSYSAEARESARAARSWAHFQSS